MEWLKDATNALGQEDSPLNKGVNNSFRIITDVSSSKFKIPFHAFVTRQTQIIPNGSQ